jgi:muramidase (phage lysozyme)
VKGDLSNDPWLKARHIATFRETIKAAECNATEGFVQAQIGAIYAALTHHPDIAQMDPIGMVHAAITLAIEVAENGWSGEYDTL